MKALPVTKDAAVLRTDFANQAAWQAICAEIQKPSAEGFKAHVEFIDDKGFAGASPKEVVASVPAKYPHTFLIIVDAKAISTKDHSVLVVELKKASGKAFRALPSTIQAIENNLSIANMDFEEFADAVDGSGVFRGF
jgi:hypothetical protein